MDIVSSVGVVVAPFLIKWITSGVKKFVVSYNWGTGQRNVVLKFVVLVLSFGAAVGTASINGGEVDPSVVSTLATGIITFVAATGFYYWSKYRKTR